MPYVSWKADPGSTYVDAFTLDWSRFSCFYEFPPFYLLNKVLRKIEQDQASGILIVPLWHTQPWFPAMLRLLVKTPIILPNREDSLVLPFSDRLHPLRDRLRLTVCLLSGKRSVTKVYQSQLPSLSLPHGDLEQRNVTEHRSTNGFTSVLRQKLIHFDQL